MSLVSQKLNKVNNNIGYDKLSFLCLEVAKEGIVLLKNENETLPLKSGVDVYGRAFIDTLYCSNGSGGDVHPYNLVSIRDGFNNKGINYNKKIEQKYIEFIASNQVETKEWGKWPQNFKELEINSRFIDQFKENNTAIFIISRATGEDQDLTLTKGSYYLTETEENSIKLLSEKYDKFILIFNCGNIIDMSFTLKYKIDSIVYMFELGEVSGNAISSTLSGECSPSGKLPVTIFKNYEDYPSSAFYGNKDFNNYSEDIYVGYRYSETFDDSKVLYPFGFGLSYTKFFITVNDFSSSFSDISFKVNVKNIGLAKGKEVIEVYLKHKSKTNRFIDKKLISFKKTKLLDINEEQTLKFDLNYDEFLIFDEDSSSYIIESGDYEILVGNSINDLMIVGIVNFDSNLVVKSVEHILPISESFNVQSNDCLIELKKPEISEDRYASFRPWWNSEKNDKNISFKDVVKDKENCYSFLESLSDKDLCDLTKGFGSMNYPRGIKGNAGAFGGITKELRDKGIPEIITCDGPSGIRIEGHSDLLPVGISLASTFNYEDVFGLYIGVSKQMVELGVDVLLAPGMNIIRNPLCGRNFEYLSEDPYLTGKMASAIVKGIQTFGLSACPKHFACNNQEFNRCYNDSRVSEKALREIYLHSFEIMINDSKPNCIMTSYNQINGVWSHYNLDLCKVYLRKELNYGGVILTDWWMRHGFLKSNPEIKDNTYRVLSGINVLMPGNLDYGINGYVSDEELLKNVGKLINRVDLVMNDLPIMGLCYEKLKRKK